MYHTMRRLFYSFAIGTGETPVIRYAVNHLRVFFTQKVMGSQNKASLTMMMLYQSTWQGGRDVAIQKPAVVASSWQTRVRETNHQKTDPPAAQAMRQTTSIFSPAGGGYGRFAGQSDGCRQADRALWPQAAVDAGAAVHLLAADKLGSLPDAGRTLREGGVVAGSSVAPTRQGEHLPGIHQGPAPQRQTALEGGGPPWPSAKTP